MRKRVLQWLAAPARSLHNRFIPHHKSNGLRPWQFSEVLQKQSLYASCFQRQCVRYYDQNFRTEFLRQKTQQNTAPPLFPFAAQPYAEETRTKWYKTLNDRSRSSGMGASSSGFFKRILKRLMKVVGGVLAISAVAAAGAPSFATFGLDGIVYLINLNIPGTLSVDSVTLGWGEPVRVEGIRLEGADSSVVLQIVEYKTSAQLWSLVAGRSGLGDAVVIQPTVDWRKDPKTGHLYFDLALTSIDKLNLINPYVKKNIPKAVPSEIVPWTAKLEAPGGSLEVLRGKIILPGDMAAVLGSHLFFDVTFGSLATKETGASWKKGKDGHTPIRCSLRSNCAHVEALAYLDFRKKRMKLLQPISAEMDLSPALAKFYLAQINPILGQIVGPSIGREDLPDVTMHVTPAGMLWPADEYFIRIEPMKVVLAKGPLLRDLLSLLSRGDLEKGNRQITMQTSAVEANVHVAGSLACSRVDLLIADKVHIATWGLMDHVHETMKMTLAIPGESLRDLLGLTKISPQFHLQIPINGSFDRPQVDWAAAGRGITELTLQEKFGGNLLSAFLEQFDQNADPNVVPKPVGAVPWVQDQPHY